MIDDDRQNLPSASNWPRYERCAGSWQLEQEAKRLKQEAHVGGAAAARGSLIHAYLAGEVDEDGEEIKLSESEQTTADFLQARAQGEVARVFGDQPVQQLDEKRLWDPQHRFSGRFDRVVYTPTLALIQDFKTGFSPPDDPIEQNAQMKVLATLVGFALPSVKEIVCELITGPFGIFEARYTMSELAKAYDSIVATLRTLHTVDAPLKPSPEACKWCPAINICQAVKNLILPVATKTQVSALPDGERAARLLDECDVISRHIDEIRAYYRRIVEQDPQAVPGWGLEQGAPRRSVENWPAARQKLEEFIDGKKLDALADYSIPSVEKLLGEAIGVRGQKLKEQFAAVLGPLLEQKYPLPALRRISGKPKVVEISLP